MNPSNSEFIILASASPRRKEMLEQLGLAFRCITPSVSEETRPRETPKAYVRRIANDKARAVLHSLRDDPADHLIIAGDTTVTLEGAILGKPATEQDATDMLLQLSGKTHQVITGVCLLLHRNRNLEAKRLFAVSTDVIFKTLTRSEVDAYVRTGDPMDKAGAYGIQSGAAHMIREIHGSYTNVVGLPMAELLEEMQALPGCRALGIRSLPESKNPNGLPAPQRAFG
ncbi:MAG: Maf family protein [Kiritimatiellae bacterium]|nr:Maf family protein [Kiritimatiellia bacterium]MDD4737162.1 Maf family protein [Kiritimatiellia bacterium]